VIVVQFNSEQPNKSLSCIFYLLLPYASLYSITQQRITNHGRNNLSRSRINAWPNGAGITYEVVRFPAEGEFQWRISLADIDKRPFSVMLR
jgi:hypothetical protein